MLPTCHTSPYGPQACTSRPDIPSQRQSVIPFSLPKVFLPRDLSRCNSVTPAAAGLLLQPSELPLSTVPRNATCLTILQAGKAPHVREGAATKCEEELLGDDELRVQLPLRFVQQVTMTPEQLLAASSSSTSSKSAARVPPPPLPAGDVYLANAFSLFSKATLGLPFGVCSLPRETEGVARMRRQLERTLGFARNQTLCVHWRGEDFHHPTTLAKHKWTASSEDVASRHVLPLARRLGARSVLLLTNARFEALGSMLGTLRAAGLAAEAPRTLDDTTFGCRANYVYATFAEMHLCSRARHFLGSPKSSFSHHIVAMRAARTGTPPGSEVQWMGLEQDRTAGGATRVWKDWKDVLDYHLLHHSVG